MTDDTLARITGLLCDFAGVYPDDAEPKKLIMARRFSLAMVATGRPHNLSHMRRPDLLERKLEHLRVQIKRTVSQLRELNEWAANKARREAYRIECLEAGMPPEKASEMLILAELIEEADWIDRKAISALVRLELALQQPIGELIHLGRSIKEGKGQKPNIQAREVALLAAKAFLLLTNKQPSYWEDGTPYEKFCSAAFKELKIKADTRRPCEWALSELAQKS